MNKRAEIHLHFPGLESNESSRYATTISTSTSRSTAFPCAARSGVCITAKRDFDSRWAWEVGERYENVIILEQAVVPNRTAL